MSTQPNEGWIPSDDAFAARLALIRNRKGWNVKEAAMACGVAPQSWRNWELGVRPHDFQQACEVIAEHSGANINWLALGSGAPGSIRSSVTTPFLGAPDLIAA